MRNDNWKSDIAWCEAHKFKWAIVNDRLYWQTNYQSAEQDADGKITWHSREYFDEITKEKGSKSMDCKTWRIIFAIMAIALAIEIVCEIAGISIC